MENSGLSASDVLALTRGNSDGFNFGGIGGFVLLFIFLLAISGNGFFGGNNGNVNQMATADLLYNQSTDNAIRGLAQGQCALTDTVLNASYNNLLASKDTQYQISNSVASLGNLITQENQATRNMIMQNKIDMLNDQIVVLRNQNSNLEQTATLTNAINNQTSEILNAQGRYYLNPPCYQGCGCGTCNGLY